MESGLPLPESAARLRAVIVLCVSAKRAAERRETSEQGVVVMEDNDCVRLCTPFCRLFFLSLRRRFRDSGGGVLGKLWVSSALLPNSAVARGFRMKCVFICVKCNFLN